jgi:nucleoside-diphosphate-sugar epimerase
VNKLYDEEAPATCGYPYGISKLQGELGVHQMQDAGFSVISLRQGTVCGYSPRMRMDLVVNTMYKSAITEGTITVNNPGLWRPILHIKDTVSAFLRAIQADDKISGVFNVASGNFTVGQVGDVVKNEVEKLTGRIIKLNVLYKQDMRNYKVTFEKAKTELGFEPDYDIKDIVRDLHAHYDEYGDFQNDLFYNIRVWMKLNL